MTQSELNQRLFEVCAVTPADLTRAEELLRLGAEPMGRITAPFCDSNVYGEIVDALFKNDDTPEDFYSVTELFLRCGMDVSKPAVPYDHDVLHPLWYFAFFSNEVVVRTLKLLLDHGLSAADAGECWGHALFDFEVIGFDLGDPIGFHDGLGIDYLYDAVRKLLLIASYPHVLTVDEDLRREIWFDRNAYDTTRFRNWNEYRFTVDTSHCFNHPTISRSLVTVFEKETGKQVWQFGLCLPPE